MYMYCCPLIAESLLHVPPTARPAHSDRPRGPEALSVTKAGLLLFTTFPRFTLLIILRVSDVLLSAAAHAPPRHLLRHIAEYALLDCQRLGIR